MSSNQQHSIPYGSGKAEEVEAVIAQYEAGLLRYATRILKDDHAAQDAVQNTFIKLCQSWKDGVRPTRQLRSWLYRVTHSQVVDYIRKENQLRGLHHKKAKEERASYPPKQRHNLDKEDAMRLALHHVKKLHPAEQQVVILRLQEGMSYQEIGEIMQRSEGNVGCILHHAVKKLSKILKKVGAI